MARVTSGCLGGGFVKHGASVTLVLDDTLSKVISHVWWWRFVWSRSVSLGLGHDAGIAKKSHASVAPVPCVLG